MQPLFILNGPNLDRLGTREPAIYGSATLADIEGWCRDATARPLRFHQSAAEHQLVAWIHDAIDAPAAGIIVNAAALTFTSIAIIDALKQFSGPVVELHISNIHRREAYYHNSYVSKVATAVMCGFGPRGYVHAVRAIEDLVSR